MCGFRRKHGCAVDDARAYDHGRAADGPATAARVRGADRGGSHARKRHVQPDTVLLAAGAGAWRPGPAWCSMTLPWLHLQSAMAAQPLAIMKGAAPTHCRCSSSAGARAQRARSGQLFQTTRGAGELVAWPTCPSLSHCSSLPCHASLLQWHVCSACMHPIPPAPRNPRTLSLATWRCAGLHEHGLLREHRRPAHQLHVLHQHLRAADGAVAGAAGPAHGAARAAGQYYVRQLLLVQRPERGAGRCVGNPPRRPRAAGWSAAGWSARCLYARACM
jgi:hypothetical protein